MQVLIIGGGGLGRALAAHYQQHGASVHVLSRQAPTMVGVNWLQLSDYEPASLQQIIAKMSSPDIVISTLGVLHNQDFMPEKRLAEVNAEQLQYSYYVNAVLPILLLQQLLPQLPKKSTCVWAQLSAKVGSITDNYLGSWYSYRASKAGLNMLLKTAAVELKRTHKQRLPADKLFTAELSAQRIAAVIDGLSAEDSGGFW